ncbi:MAG: Serine/threonine-protein kinase PknB [Labilithrix sp.]|nr:Serine/threonine-protein kinase PknB [Labilithrix sp.]
MHPSDSGVPERMGDDHSGVTSLGARPATALTVGEVIGEGGMGVVRAATQNSLGRSVAIKTAHPGAAEHVAARVLAEAWVTGYLEHPGVVPVYDIVEGDGGVPMVVMRRIHGKTWHERIDDASWAAAAGARDLLEQNLRIVVRLCEIVEFAHAKGVVHRDIKPENVMLGSFGEVYLLDWGLAVATTDAAAGQLPRAASVKDMGGTLHYAAPEMIGLVDAHVSEATDIYLLGAVLHEIATGRAPHDQATAPLIFESIARSPPTDWGKIAPRLAAIGQRAMQKLPTNRYSTVSALRRDVLDYLKSRDSEHLAAFADRALVALTEAVRKNSSRRKIYDLYGECRFAFREALRTWPANEAARAGLARASTLVIEHELGRDPRIAVALLDEAAGIEPELVARVREASVNEAHERATHSRVHPEHEPGAGRRLRAVLFGFLGLAWTVSQLLGDRVGPQTFDRDALGSIVQVPFLAIAWLVARGRTRNLFNRRIFGSVALLIVAQCLLFESAGPLGLTLVAARTLQIGLWAVVAASMTLVLERKLWPMTLGLSLAFLVAIAWPELRPLVSGLATLGVTANVAVVWARRGS